MPPPLPLHALHHVAVASRDCDASLAFYRDVLGFRPLERPNFNFAGAWLFKDGLQIHIIENRPQTDGEKIDPRAEHVAFAVDDFDEVERCLKAHGVTYHKQVNAGGIPQIFFHDPDGHHIEIGIYPPTPPFKA
ncbi:MAG: VOC family protein [Pirellulales bacterium]